MTVNFISAINPSVVWKQRTAFVSTSIEYSELTLQLSKSHEEVAIALYTPNDVKVIAITLDDLLLALSELAKDDV